MKMTHVPVLIGLFIMILIVAPCLAQQGDGHRDVIIPQIKMDDVPVPDAIVHLARRAEINYIADSRVSADTNMPHLTINFENVTAKEALDRILKIRRLVRIESPATTVSRIVPANLGIKPVDPELLKNDTNAVCPKIVMDEVPLRDALRLLAKQAGIKITIDENVKAVQSTYISLRWTNLTVKQALAALLDNYDLTMIEDASGGTAKIIEKYAPLNSR
jgi:hypothetical protein